MSNEWLLDIQRKGERFLLRLFEMTKGNPVNLVPFGEVIEGWGWTEDNCSDVEDYLTGKGLIKQVSFGSASTGSYSITRHGRRWAEGKLLDTYGVVEPGSVSGPLKLMSELRFQGSPFQFTQVLKVFSSWQSHESSDLLSVGFFGRHPDADYLKSDISMAIPDRAQIGRLEVLRKPDDSSLLRIYLSESHGAIFQEWWAPIFARMVTEGYFDSETAIDEDNGERTDESQELIGADLSPRDQAIIEIYNERLSEQMPITDEFISDRLCKRGFYNKRTGYAYSRESVNRWRNNLIKKGYDLGV